MTAKFEQRQADAKLAAVVQWLNVVLDATDYTAKACAPTEMVGAVLSREVIQSARAALAAAREQPTQEPHAFEPCREGDSGDDPAHNFTCALLCVHCGLLRERHPTRRYQDPVDEADDALEASQRPFVEITREDLARVFEPGSCGNHACPACGESVHQPTQDKPEDRR